MILSLQFRPGPDPVARPSPFSGLVIYLLPHDNHNVPQACSPYRGELEDWSSHT
jgi:hypothetical protein